MSSRAHTETAKDAADTPEARKERLTPLAIRIVLLVVSGLVSALFWLWVAGAILGFAPSIAAMVICGAIGAAAGGVLSAVLSCVS